MTGRRPRWTQETQDLAQAAARRLTDSYTAGVSNMAPSDENIAIAVLGVLADRGLLLPPGRVPGDEQLLGMEVKDGATTVSIEASRAWMLEVAEHLINLVEVDAGANYAEWDIKPAGQGDPYRIILVRPGGKSPHELRLEAEKERCDYDCDHCRDRDDDVVDWPEGY